MNARGLLLSLLLTSTLTAGVLGQGSPTPVNHLISVIQANQQELVNAAQISSAQQAYSVVTRIVNQILKAMQQMSLPYYQSQLIYLQNQQISLSNRLTALQARVSSEATMLLKMTGSVSSSLAAQTANIGSVLMAFINTIDPKISQLQTNFNALNAVLPSAVAQVAAIAAKQPLIQSALGNLTAQLTNLTNRGVAIANEVSQTYRYTTDLVNKPLTATFIPYCFEYALNWNLFSAPPLITYFVFQTTLSTPPSGVLDLVYVSETAQKTTMWLCDRSKTGFNPNEGRLYIEYRLQQ